MTTRHWRDLLDSSRGLDDLEPMTDADREGAALLSTAMDRMFEYNQGRPASSGAEETDEELREQGLALLRRLGVDVDAQLKM